MKPRGSEWQWHQLGHMQVCTLFQTDNHASTPPLSFLQAGCPSCHPTNSVKALKAVTTLNIFFTLVKHSYKHYINHNPNCICLDVLISTRNLRQKKLFSSSCGGSCHSSDVTWQEIGRTCGSVYITALVPVHRTPPRPQFLSSFHINWHF